MTQYNEVGIRRISLAPTLSFIDHSPGAAFIHRHNGVYLDISKNRDSSTNAHTSASPTLTPVFRDTSFPREINLCFVHRPFQIHAYSSASSACIVSGSVSPSKWLQLFDAVEGDSGRRWDGTQMSDARVISPSIFQGTSRLGTDNMREIAGNGGRFSRHSPRAPQKLPSLRLKPLVEAGACAETNTLRVFVHLEQMQEHKSVGDKDVSRCAMVLAGFTLRRWGLAYWALLSSYPCELRGGMDRVVYARAETCLIWEFFKDHEFLS
ncbi:hypothetical protein R3P38DRAFT_3175392 [Favolaschia claudopus]|uniref:Uncharacterized protein n=1 Tax=Favolaschia claudopus TaxID=2862362 RepID=A0AAW0DCY3_9AGAR